MMAFIFLFVAFIISLLAALLITPLVRKLAIVFNIVDQPDERKIHTMEQPYLGGIAIFLGVMITYMMFWPNHDHQLAVILGAVVMLIVGFLDDKYNLKPVVKLIGQFIAASIIVASDLLIERINIPFLGEVELGNLSVIITIIWIIAVANAINLIDGLDGLAAGVTTIALLSIGVTAILDANYVVAFLCIITIGSNLGFLYHNFYPSKIYMGDSGSLFLGYMIAVISMLGLFKNVTLFSFFIPLIILAVPILDTIFVMYTRAKDGESIMLGDRKHLHYRLIDSGLSHRGAVLVIYAFSGLFGALGVLFSYSPINAVLIGAMVALFLVHVIAEIVGLVLGGKQPVLDFLKKFIVKKRK
ncbi:undecaprenyl/decaprenyl-phosphate alpha-N-acetylglucosaminyl 1-phosphate transferase [Allobacillus salarius]|uniref:Undecaprenyl/decaprenyl-phosphate alpha-N-acetylglucosaminyl 1-phosphate transferase n=2 Tax=Bacillaceae TaxID=186817 RepID=A0A556PMX9_9BACI|nr:undecaprenyl/decaprenyl-phosphate alpha-N-acetylglucosaminyl 1-phosphate transferase [Allobacillus salarius]